MFILFFVIFILLSVAFYTLLERKIISLEQNRLGPDKFLFFGILQPVADGFKLFLKNMNYYFKTSIFFFLSPLFSFFISFTMWSITTNFSLKLFILFLLFFLSLGVYVFIISGWASFSKFGYVGGMRASSQTVSYEISLSLIVFSCFYLFFSFKIVYFYNFFIYFVLIPSSLGFFISMIAETNRAPFDFSEGESELISGFNIEYGSSGFVLFFLSEYGSMIFFSYLFMIIFYKNFFVFFFILFLFVKFRTSFPRFRFDFLMEFMWKMILPFFTLFCFLMIVF